MLNNKKGISLIILVLIVVLIIVVGAVTIVLVINNSNNKDNSLVPSQDTKLNKNENIISQVSSNELFVVFDKSTSDSKAMRTNFESSKVDKYDYIEQYTMKWDLGSSRYSMNVPVIPNRTYSLNSYSTSDITIESNICNIDYSIYNMDINKEQVNNELQKTITQYTNNNVYSISKYSDIYESNNVIGYAYSINTLSSKQVRIAFYKNGITNNVSSEGFTFYGFISFDINNYEQAQPIINELSEALNFNIMKLINSVK